MLGFINNISITAYNLPSQKQETSLRIELKVKFTTPIIWNTTMTLQREKCIGESGYMEKNLSDSATCM